MSTTPEDDSMPSQSASAEAQDAGEASEAKARKERVLHTRVPAVLEQELKRLAESLRIPVSNVVRTILEDAIDAVDVAGRRAEGEIRGVAERLAEERRRLRTPLLGVAAEPPRASGPVESEAKAARTAAKPSADAEAAVEAETQSSGEVPFDVLRGAVGFTPMVLAYDSRCAVTGRPLRAGEQAYLVLFTEPGRHAIVSVDVPPRPR